MHKKMNIPEKHPHKKKKRDKDHSYKEEKQLQHRKVPKKGH
jgi:hypothetical protein